MNYLNKIIYILVFVLMSNTALAQEKSVEQFVTSVANTTISIVTSPNTSEKQKRQNIKQMINHNFDTIWMSKFVLGRNYKILSEQQQKEYHKLYLNYLVSNYFPILMKYDNDKFSVKNINKVSKNSYNVDTIIIRVGKPSISIQYHIKDVQSSLKAVDMVVEGISTIISQRSEFDSIIQQEGVNGFMKKMREKYN